MANAGNGDLTNRYLYRPAVDQILADEQVTASREAMKKLGQAPRDQ